MTLTPAFTSIGVPFSLPRSGKWDMFCRCWMSFSTYTTFSRVCRKERAEVSALGRSEAPLQFCLPTASLPFFFSNRTPNLTFPTQNNCFLASLAARGASVNKFWSMRCKTSEKTSASFSFVLLPGAPTAILDDKDKGYSKMAEWRAESSWVSKGFLQLPKQLGRLPPDYFYESENQTFTSYLGFFYCMQPLITCISQVWKRRW